MKRSRKEHDNKWCSGHKKCYKIVKICDRYHSPARVSWDEKCTREKYGKSNLLGRDLEVNKKEKRGLIYIWGKKIQSCQAWKKKNRWFGSEFFYSSDFFSSLSSHHVLPPIFSLKVSNPRIFYMVKDHSSITIILITIIR